MQILPHSLSEMAESTIDGPARPPRALGSCVPGGRRSVGWLQNLGTERHNHTSSDQIRPPEPGPPRSRDASRDNLIPAFFAPPGRVVLDSRAVGPQMFQVWKKWELKARRCLSRARSPWLCPQTARASFDGGRFTSRKIPHQ